MIRGALLCWECSDRGCVLPSRSREWPSGLVAVSGQQRHRARYEKPRVISEDCFETLALSCALANPFVCPGGAPDRS
jgi:hypothetical protein